MPTYLNPIGGTILAGKALIGYYKYGKFVKATSLAWKIGKNIGSRR